MKLSEYLHARGLTDGAFATRVGRDRTSVLRWRRGETIPDPDALRAIADATGNAVTPNDFLLSDDAKTAPAPEAAAP